MLDLAVETCCAAAVQRNPAGSVRIAALAHEIACGVRSLLLFVLACALRAAVAMSDAVVAAGGAGAASGAGSKVLAPLTALVTEIADLLVAVELEAAAGRECEWGGG